MTIVGTPVRHFEGDRATIHLSSLVLVDFHAVQPSRVARQGKAAISPLKTRTVVVPPLSTDKPNSVPRSTTLPPEVSTENPRACGGTRGQGAEIQFDRARRDELEPGRALEDDPSALVN